MKSSEMHTVSCAIQRLLNGLFEKRQIRNQLPVAKKKRKGEK